MEQSYIGTELELFQHATNWKKYLKKEISPHLEGNILELGAGLGSNTKIFSQGNPKIQSWTCIEPDSKLANKIETKSQIPTEVIVGTLDSLQTNKKFDSAIYIDVLEHIEQDYNELKKLLSFLNPGGKLVIMSPAHQFLYSPFDKKIGHYRRYNKSSLLKVIPKEFELNRLYYLDSIGFFASLANRYFLKASDPSLSQIRFWDSFLVRASLYIDPILGKKMGKSILGIWSKR